MEEAVINIHFRPVAASCLLAAALGLPMTVALSPAANAISSPPSSMHAPFDDMGGMSDPTTAPTPAPMNNDTAMPVESAAPPPSQEPMHDMEPVTGYADEPDMAGASHEAATPMPASDDMAPASIAPDSHDSGDGHVDEMSDMNSDDSADHGGGPFAVTTPPEAQRKVVLAGFAAVNLLIFAGAGILRRTGRGSRGLQRAKQGSSKTPRRTGTDKQDTGDQA
jgi:hypothetical protein